MQHTSIYPRASTLCSKESGKGHVTQGQKMHRDK